MFVLILTIIIFILLVAMLISHLIFGFGIFYIYRKAGVSLFLFPWWRAFKEYRNKYSNDKKAMKKHKIIKFAGIILFGSYVTLLSILFLSRPLGFFKEFNMACVIALGWLLYPLSFLGIAI